MTQHYDAIVIGSGITGGWAAKELTEGGLTVLMLERGRMVEHAQDYETESKEPWEMPFRGLRNRYELEERFPIQTTGQLNEYTAHFYVDDREEPYRQTKPFNWIRGYQLGGRSLIWGRQSLRRGAADFRANAEDGHGVPWPIGYDDLAPWYDHVEEFIGVSGQEEGNSAIPDGRFTPAIPLNCIEQSIKEGLEREFPGRTMTCGRTANLTEPRPGRGLCQFRNQCARGCSWGGYFSTQSSTLPAAQATGRLTVKTDARALRIVTDADRKAAGVEILDANTGRRETIPAGLVFLCASTFNSLAVLMNSSTPEGQALGNSSGLLGRYIMDHLFGLVGIGMMAGETDRVSIGRKPTWGIIMPFRNRGGEDRTVNFTRSYSYGVLGGRMGWERGASLPGIGGEFKDSLAHPGPWTAIMAMMGEHLPRADNRMTLDHSVTDRDGMPQIAIDVDFGENDRAIFADSVREGRKILAASALDQLPLEPELATPGTSIHEMGGAPMGDDPRRSVLDRFNRLHDAPNVYVTDGAAMNSSASQNPSLTYMAVTARAAQHAVEQINGGLS